MNDSLRLDEFFPYRLSVASNLISDAIAGTYRAIFGLNIPEWRLIAVLAEREVSTPNDLCLATRMDKVTVSRSAAALLGRGLVGRSPNPRDRRSHLLSLTSAGRRLYADVVPRALALEKALLAEFTRDDVQQFLSMLRRLEAHAQNLKRTGD